MIYQFHCIYSKESKAGTKIATCIPTFITTVSFTIAKSQKHLVCPSTDEQIMHTWYIHAVMYTFNGYIHTTEYYSTLKNEILTYVTTWMNLENIMLIEISQAQKDKYCMIPFISNTQKRQIHKESKTVVSGGLGKRGMENYCLFGTDILSGIMKKFQKLVVVISQHGEYT